ncbi:hypothetical protein FHS23_003741 [Prauserella isguenensis]|uniref:Uncharacterized protein n=1 Tax=Prauserella isguenensis TaxID=1470180 RepID=A0A839S7T0_9PSEU|nr:hypothetical protein [Prauserella isguenensis]
MTVRELAATRHASEVERTDRTEPPITVLLPFIHEKP